MRDYKQLSQESFDRQAPTYDTASYGAHARTLYPILLSQIGQIPHDSLLDVGCGTGALLWEILRRWPDTRCAGVDLSGEMTARARQRLESQAEILQGDAERLPFPSGHFSVAVCSDSFHHYPAPALALREIHRVLRPGGVFLLGDTTAPIPLRQLMNLLLPFGHGGDVRLYSPKELTALLSEVFHGVECRKISATSLLAWGLK